ncbi:MAG: vancomycin resistance protein, partial [Desulfitobacterium sp.]|nr:vancomycin resistance protein [Desulfitobacterium sp.]
TYFEEIYSSGGKPNMIILGGSAVVPDETINIAQDLLTGRTQGTTIYGIEDLYVEIFQGKEYSLPRTVEARLYNSEKVTLPVKWNSSSVDNKALGLQVFEGVVKGYDKPIKLNLLVNDNPLISEYTTYFNLQDVNRTENIRLAAKAIDGKVLEPGEVFSFNETVGRRTTEAGYKQAIIIEGRTFVLGLGGGICQVSSTLYNAVDLAQFEIIERHHHSLRINYVPPGKDAAVYYGVLDFRFRNNTKESLILRTSVKDNALTMKILRK